MAYDLIHQELRQLNPAVQSEVLSDLIEHYEHHAAMRHRLEDTDLVSGAEFSGILRDKGYQIGAPDAPRIRKEKDLRVPSPIRHEFSSPAEMATHLKAARSHVDVIFGHGSKGGFKDLAALERSVDDYIIQRNKTYGEGQWSAVYGGDGGITPEKPDVGYVMRHLAKRGVKVYAIQQSSVRGSDWDVPEFVSGVLYLPETEDANGKTVWGGVEKVDGRLVPQGKTAGYLGSDFRSTLGEALSVVSFGGGDIARAEIEYARQEGVPTEYYRQPVARPDAVGSEFGSVDSLFP